MSLRPTSGKDLPPATRADVETIWESRILTGPDGSPAPFSSGAELPLSPARALSSLMDGLDTSGAAVDHNVVLVITADEIVTESTTEVSPLDETRERVFEAFVQAYNVARREIGLPSPAEVGRRAAHIDRLARRILSGEDAPVNGKTPGARLTQLLAERVYLNYLQVGDYLERGEPPAEIDTDGPPVGSIPAIRGGLQLRQRETLRRLALAIHLVGGPTELRWTSDLYDLAGAVAGASPFQVREAIRTDASGLLDVKGPGRAERVRETAERVVSRHLVDTYTRERVATDMLATMADRGHVPHRDVPPQTRDTRSIWAQNTAAGRLRHLLRIAQAGRRRDRGGPLSLREYLRDQGILDGVRTAADPYDLFVGVAAAAALGHASYASVASALGGSLGVAVLNERATRGPFPTTGQGLGHFIRAVFGRGAHGHALRELRNWARALPPAPGAGGRGEYAVYSRSSDASGPSARVAPAGHPREDLRRAYPSDYLEMLAEVRALVARRGEPTVSTSPETAAAALMEGLSWRG